MRKLRDVRNTQQTGSAHMASNNPYAENQSQTGILRGEPRAPGTPDASLYDLIGGEKGLRALVETFYDIVEFEDAGSVLHVLHRRGHGTAHSRIEQFDFMSGFLGGPRLYVTHHGHSDAALCTSTSRSGRTRATPGSTA